MSPSALSRSCAARSYGALTPGFDDPVHGAQRVFSALMDAMARPGRVARLWDLPDAPAPLFPTTGAVLLALGDYDSPLWFDDALVAETAVLDWVAFHTGAARVEERHAASFAVLATAEAGSDLDGFALGTADYPDRSTTIVLQVLSLVADEGLVLTGPGIEKEHRLGVAGLPSVFVSWWQGNRASFPLGVDLILCAPDAIACLPRTVNIEEAG